MGDIVLFYAGRLLGLYGFHTVDLNVEGVITQIITVVPVKLCSAKPACCDLSATITYWLGHLGTQNCNLQRFSMLEAPLHGRLLVWVQTHNLDCSSVMCMRATLHQPEAAPCWPSLRHFDQSTNSESC